MKKRVMTYLVWTAAVLSFLAACAEGWFYYADYVHLQPFHLLLIAQNAIKTFLFSPSIGADKVLATLTGTISAAERAAGYAYLVAVFLAPLCTGCALWSAFERQLRRAFHFLAVKQEEIVIFGYNEQVQCLLSHETSKQARKAHGSRPRICVISDTALPPQEELQLLRQGVSFHHDDCLNMDTAARRKMFAALGFSNFKTIFLFEPSSAQNLSLYLTLLKHYESYPEDFGTQVTVYSSCETQAVRRLYGEMHDQLLEKRKQQNAAPMALELVLFSIPELKTGRMFELHPLHTCNASHAAGSPDPDNPDHWNVHLLIAGFGTNGQQVLTQALNRGVLHSQSAILVDIFDIDIDRRREVFLRSFDSDCIEYSPSGDTVTLHPELADGSLQLRFHRTDLCGQHFAAKLRSIQQEMPLTYAAICVNNTDVSIHCLTALRQLKAALKQKDLPYSSFPVVLNLEQDEPVSRFLDGDMDGYRDVSSICSNAEILKLDHIVNKAQEDQARRYHTAYETIQLHSAGTAPDTPRTWDQLALFQRDANRFLHHHAPVKQAVMAARNIRASQFLNQLQIGEDYSYVGTVHQLLERVDACPPAREMMMLEHRRWCYVMALQGWSWAPKKNEDNLLTPYLTRWEALREQNPHMCPYDLIAFLVPAENEEEDPEA